jgi:hypothetical protein
LSFPMNTIQLCELKTTGHVYICHMIIWSAHKYLAFPANEVIQDRWVHGVLSLSTVRFDAFELAFLTICI